MTNAEEVAEWMAESLLEHGLLYQHEAAFDIRRRFGEEFVFINRNGNWAISPEVLEAFRSMTPDVVWGPRQRLWRLRESHDPAEGRRSA